MKRFIALAVTLVIIPACRWSHMPIDTAIERTQNDYPLLPATTYLREPESQVIYTGSTLSLEHAIDFAMEHNPKLQAFLENLGVAKSDLTQASRLSNPDADFAVRMSETYPGKNIEFETLTSISDLWQVPLRYNMSEHEYHAMRHAVIARILDTARDTKKAYIQCLYAQEDRKLVTSIYEESQQLRDQIYTRYEHGYHTDLDLHLADTSVDRWYMEYRQAHAREAEAYVILESILGLTSGTIQNVPFDHTFMLTSLCLPESQDLLIEQAFTHRPELQELEERIAQYQSQIQFEQSRVFPRVDLGASFEQELSGEHLRGPALSLEIPIFDANQAPISRASYLKRRSEKELRSQKTGISSEVAIPYHELRALQGILNRYQKHTKQSLEQASAYTERYADQKRLTIPTMLQTRIILYETQRDYLMYMRDTWNQIFDLERAVGTDMRDTMCT